MDRKIKIENKSFGKHALYFRIKRMENMLESMENEYKNDYSKKRVEDFKKLMAKYIKIYMESFVRA